MKICTLQCCANAINFPFFKCSFLGLEISLRVNIYGKSFQIAVISRDKVKALPPISDGAPD